jgi:hypothetical protein
MREQIALIEVPIFDITDARSHRLVQSLGEIDVLGNLCHVMTTGKFVEFWVGKRRFELRVEDLLATAGVAIEAHLRGEIRARVLAARGAVPEDDGYVTLHPRVGH